MPHVDQPARSSGLSRRDFISRSSTLALGAAVGGTLSAQPRARATPPAHGQPATVVRVRSDNVIHVQQVDRRVLAQMLHQGLTAVTGASSSTQAWKKLLKPDDIVGLKFNRSAADALGTTLPMADVLVRSLSEAGFAPAQIVPIEVPEAVYGETGACRPNKGWAAQETAFGSGRDHLAGVLDQVTAIINVPFLKTHNIAGLTCCLKNLSHALVKHPARFHANHCSPYIADIVALPKISGKLRLHIVNSLRLVFDGGPEATQAAVASGGVLFFGTDPVAVDTVGLEHLNHKRLEEGLEPIRPNGGRLQYLPRAAELGLGCCELPDIALVKIQT